MNNLMINHVLMLDRLLEPAYNEKSEIQAQSTCFMQRCGMLHWCFRSVPVPYNQNMFFCAKVQSSKLKYDNFDQGKL